MAPNNTTSEEQRDRSGDRGAGAGPIIGGAVFVGIITACALVLSYHGLFQLAEYGGHEGSAFAHVFPVTYALLVLMAFWVSYVLRSAPPRDRLWVDVGLIPLLILAAGATMAARNLGLFDPQVEGALLSERAANVIVAVAPLAALLVAILLWITVRAHMRRRHQNAARRPRPSADRTTVLPGRRPTVEDAEPAPLKARLLDLGQSPRGGAPDEDRVETERLPVAGDADHGQGSEPEELPEPEPGEELSARSEEGPRPTADVFTPAPGDGPGNEEEGPGDEQGPAARPEAAAGPVASLPRRPSGDNPIKRAAEDAPVVPDPSRPRDPATDADAASEFRPVVVPDHLADEGFEHQSPVGDPATDEAEAPVVAESVSADTSETVPPSACTRMEPTPPVRATERSADRAPGTPTDPVYAVEAPSTDPTEPSGTPVATDEPSLPTAAEPSVTPATNTGPAVSGTTTPAPVSVPDEPLSASTAPSTAPDEEDRYRTSEAPAAEDEPAWDEGPSGADLWEPPAEETGGILDDYVPPVWTPPEDDGPATGPIPEKDEGPAPSLDHDTGPEVRAAFGRGGDGPTEPADSTHEETAEEDTAHRTADPPRETPPPLHRTPPPPAKPRSSPAALDRDARSLDKRPMVLKPRRPPIPDLSSGPPSRQVRSEPMRPED